MTAAPDADRVEVLATGGGTQLAPEAPDPFDDDSTGPWPIHGLAAVEGGVTYGGSEKRTVWPRSTLESAAPLLEGKHLVSDQKHDPDEQPGVREVIGEVLSTEYIPGRGIGYEASVDDREHARQIARGRVESSPYLYRSLADERRDVDGEEARVADVIHGFDSLAVVREGAFGPDVQIRPGGLDDTAAEALAEAFSVDELAEPSTGPPQNKPQPNMSDSQDPDPSDDKTLEQLSDENRQLRRRVKELELEHREIKGGLAEALAERSPFDASEIEERFSYTEMRSRFDDGADVVETLTPAPRTRDPDPTGETGGSSSKDTLSADDEAELETLRQRREVLDEFATEDRLSELDDQIETLAAGEQQ